MKLSKSEIKTLRADADYVKAYLEKNADVKWYEMTVADDVRAKIYDGLAVIENNLTKTELDKIHFYQYFLKNNETGYSVWAPYKRHTKTSQHLTSFYLKEFIFYFREVVKAVETLYKSEQKTTIKMS